MNDSKIGLLVFILLFSTFLSCNTFLVFAQKNEAQNLEQNLSEAKKNLSQNPNKAFEQLTNIISSIEDVVDIDKKIDILQTFVLCTRNLGYNTIQLEYQATLVELLKNNSDKTQYLLNLIELGELESKIASHDKAIAHFIEALSLAEKENKTELKAKLNNLIGVSLRSIKEFERAKEHFDLALTLSNKYNFPKQKADALNNIGGSFYIQRQYDSAFFYFEAAYLLRKSNHFTHDAAKSLNNMALVYKRKGDFKKALSSLLEALLILEKQKNIGDLSHIYDNIGDTYYVMGEHENAIKYHLKGLHYAELSSLKEAKLESYRSLVEAYLGKGDHVSAFNFMQKYANVKDTIFDEQRSRQAAQLEAQYGFDKQKKELDLMLKQKEIQEAENQKQTIVIYAFIIVTLMGIALFLLIYNRFKSRKRINLLLQHKNAQIQQTNAEIEAQRDHVLLINTEVEKQKQAIEDQNTSLTFAFAEINAQNAAIRSSIQYAKRIQTALLPTIAVIKKQIPDIFIFFKPRDIVSGDFYWYAYKEPYIYIAAADCTGHGVPGALVSMIGDSSLNQIINNYNTNDPSEILMLLHQQIFKSLKQKENDTKDGMDIAICVINLNEKKLKYAGAKSPLLYFSEGEEFFIKADKIPIGGDFSEGLFEYKTHEISFEKPTTFYMYSDGFQDQFGGAENRKFMSKEFRRLLKENHQESMDKQYFTLEEKLRGWQGSLAQTDDIMVIGLRLS